MAQDGVVKQAKTIIDVTPTLNTNAYASGDALFNRAEIPNAVLNKGGCSKLVNITVTSKKASSTPMQVVLFGSDQSLESANDAMDITAAEGAAANFCGWVDIPDDGGLDMGDFVINMPVNETGAKPKLPFMLKADSTSKSVFFTAIIGGSVTYAASDLTFRFHIEY
tara:strand:+ start:6328 stop:6825 length:498 start_codon:yes stop_codon:yes gene_type:complete